MKILNNEEMLKVKGGVAFKTATIVTSLFVLVMGIIDGLVHPKKCN